MSIITPIPPETPRYKRWFYAIPIVGWMARDVIYGSRDNQLWFAIIVASLWLMAVARWGIAVLLVPFVLIIPVALVGLFNVLVWSRERKVAKARAGTGQ